MKMDRRQKILLAVFLVAVLVIAVIPGIKAYMDQEHKRDVLKRLAEDGILIYGADQNAPPLRFLDEDGIYKGVVVDFMNQLSLEIGVEIKTVPYLWEDALAALENGDTDICDMFMNEERSAKYAATKSIYNLRTVLAIQGDSDFTLEDINHMSIATQKGDYANAYLKKNYSKAELVYVPDVSSGMKLLSEKKVDAVIGDEPVVYYTMSHNKDYSSFKLINTALYEEDVVLALNKQKSELIPILNDAITNIRNKGQLEKIQQKWFGISTPLLKANPRKDFLKFFGIPMGAVLAILIFIMVNNHALKRQVKERTVELEDSRNELQMIFDGITEYIAVISKDKVIMNANQGLMNCLRKKQEAVFGQPCEGLFSVLCKDCSACPIDECLESGGTVKREVAIESEVYEMAVYGLSDSQSGVLITLRNVSIEKIQRNQLLQSSKMIAIGQLAAGMAHEIRNPLGIIRTQSYLLRSGERLSETASKSLDFIDANIKRAGGIIDNVMKFWRVSDDKPEHLNLRESMQDIIALQSEETKKKKIKISLDCDPNIWVYCSTETLKHILLNLSANAIDALDEGGILRICGELRKHAFCVICEDNGSGIDENHLDTLFNPFFTTKEPGKGTGLGLFIVYSEVQRLNGTITVDSELGKGTKFTIVIPQEQEKESRYKKAALKY
ncbi:transporter substrate-binding domain-containing protein [Sinanaerobacter sp. ZZT-01]|uniref:transporter substrate-binding domain-containing protein n=1 Tax=Sinanaerobacter sp. ZZT-01 TaxID=3111540 RepID=UPI002D76E0F9|nr:transporter substrate-binding domain-containing protein [Sinanaerobacter sp. ZZT-01]WRR94911.1 transporter substrate-binding domain-containing protein [Sinanaerobacter sp. ZZT-01]